MSKNSLFISVRPKSLGHFCKSVWACQEGFCSENSSLLTKHEITNEVIIRNRYQIETQPGVGRHCVAQLVGCIGLSAVWMEPLELGSLRLAQQDIWPWRILCLLLAISLPLLYSLKSLSWSSLQWSCSPISLLIPFPSTLAFPSPCPCLSLDPDPCITGKPLFGPE